MAEIRALLIVLMIFSGAIIGLAGFYGDLFSTYNVSNPHDLSSLSVATQVTEKTQAIEAGLKIKPTVIPLDIVTDAWGYINAALNALSLIFDSVFLFHNLIVDVVSIVGVPSWIVSIAYGIILIIVIFEVISAYLKYPV